MCFDMYHHFYFDFNCFFLFTLFYFSLANLADAYVILNL